MNGTILDPGGGRGPASSEGRGRGGSGGIGSERVWSLLGWIGVVLAVIGSADIVLTWYPLDFGNVEWEFGTVSQSFNGLPSVTMGFGIWLASVLALRRKRPARWLSAGFVILALVVIGAAVLYAATVPVALGSVPANAVATGLKKSIAKTALQSLIYPVVFAVVGIKGWKAAGRLD